MPFVTQADIYKARTKLSIVVKNPDSGVLNHIYWFKVSDLVQYTQFTKSQVLIWWTIYWCNEYPDGTDISNRSYYHYVIFPDGSVKKMEMPSNIINSSTEATVRTQGEDAGNIFTDKKLLKQMYVPVDSYGWLFNTELDEINSMNQFGPNPDNNINVKTFEQITLFPLGSMSSKSNWKPPTGSSTPPTGSTGSTGPAPPVPPTDPGQDSTCKTTLGIMDSRRKQDSSRTTYIQPDLTFASYTEVKNASDYGDDVMFYYKFKDVYSEIGVYDYIYYVRPIVPTNGLDKLYVRIDPNGNTNAAKSSTVFDPKTYPTISWGSKAFNIFTISQSSEWSVDNLYIPTTFYGGLFRPEHDYFKDTNCYQTFQNITYKDISEIDDSKNITNNQTVTEPPIGVTDPVVVPPPVNTNDPDDPNNVPPVDTSDPDDYGQNDIDDNTVVVDENGNVVGDGGTTVTKSSGDEVLNAINDTQTGKDTQPIVSSTQKMDPNIGLIAGLLLAGIVIYAVVNGSHNE